MWSRRLVILFAVLAAVMPLSRHVVDGSLPGHGMGPVDGIHSVFYYEVFAERLRGHGSLGRIDEMWFPLGRPLLLAQQNIVDALLAAPLLLALGPGRGTALFVALTMASNVLAGAWLAGRVTDNTASRLCGALILGFAPYLWDEIEFGRYTQAWLAPTAVTVGMAWTAASGSYRQALWAGLALAFTGYHYWFYGLFAAVVVLGVMLGHGRDALPRLGVVAVVALLGVLPFMVYVATSWSSVPGAGTPPHFGNVARLVGGLPGVEKGDLYLPQLLVAAAVVALFPRQRGPVLGAVLAGGWLLAVSLGEYVTVGNTTLATPYHYLVQLPFLDRFWWPQRALGAATVAAAIPLARLAGLPRWGAAGACVVAGLSAAQAVRVPGFAGTWTLSPRPAWDAALPPGPVLALPLLSTRAGEALFRAWPTHRRPLVNGMSMWERPLWPGDYRTWFEADPFLAALLAAEQGRPAPGEAPSLAGLQAAGVVGVVATWNEVPAPERALLVEVLGEARVVGGDHAWTIQARAP